ncbi:hypothetical protein LguiA_021993 [Lonicera macranthoides]
MDGIVVPLPGYDGIGSQEPKEVRDVTGSGTKVGLGSGVYQIGLLLNSHEWEAISTFCFWQGVRLAAVDSHKVPSGTTLELNAQNGLVLTDPQGTQLWSSLISGTVDHGFINDTGNFVLVGTDSPSVWESFDYPTDTLLPTQTMEINGVLNSRISDTNFSQGRFQFRLLDEGNVVLNPRDVVSNFAYDSYYSSNTHDSSNSSNSGRQLVFNQTGHMFINLVRLLGFCDDGENHLLVYEYMCNCTLASFLFGVSKQSWNLRTRIAKGIARGLLYLHDECTTQIIHCDIKIQNVLLDDYYNAKISNFRSATLLMVDESQNKIAIRGTKSDMSAHGREILSDWVWDCFQEGKLVALVENDVEALNDMKTLVRFVMVGLWCIQEDPFLRPSMRKAWGLPVPKNEEEAVSPDSNYSRKSTKEGLFPWEAFSEEFTWKKVDFLNQSLDELTDTVPDLDLHQRWTRPDLNIFGKAKQVFVSE